MRSFHRAHFEAVTSSRLEFMQRHVQSFHDHRQVPGVRRRRVVVDVVVALVPDNLGTIERRVYPVQPDAGGGQRARAQVHRRREISTSGLAHCQQTPTSRVVNPDFMDFIFFKIREFYRILKMPHSFASQKITDGGQQLL